MKASVERLRWGLAGAAVLLLVLLVGFIGYGHYRAVRTWERFVKRSGVHITHETDGFTYSQSLQGRTVFTLHAAKAIQHGDGKWSLHNATMTLYGKNAADVDHIYGSDFEYDQNTGIARALGEVNMDIQAPGALAGGSRAHHEQGLKGWSPATAETAKNGAPEEGNDHIIYVRTSGLVYVRKLQVAATDQQVEFSYAGLQCTAKGAEFDSGESLLHLLANVVMTGNVRGEPMTIHADKADLNRQNNTVALLHPAARSQGHTATAANALLHLRTDGSLERAEADGSVSFGAGTRLLTAAHVEGTFNAASAPQTAKLTGGVALQDSDPVRPLHAQASEVDASFDALGTPVSVLATGAAQVSFNDRKAGAPGLARELKGDRILATFKVIPPPEGRKEVSRLSEVHAMGSAMASGQSLAVPAGKQKASELAELRSTQIAADDLRAVFDPDAPQNSQLRQVFGQGHTRLQQDAPQGEQQISSADTLEMEFAAPAAASATALAQGSVASLQIASATQVGHVTIHSRPAMRASGVAPEPSDASAERAVYDGATQKLSLTGAARFTQGQTALTAATIMLDQRSGDADAEGRVLATMWSAQSPNSQAAAAPPTHISADRAHLAHDSQLAEFDGTEAHPARLWQEASQVEAASLLFDRKRRSLAARPASSGGRVHAVFASASPANEKNASRNSNEHARRSGHESKAQGADQVVRVTSAAMDYTDLERDATFTGGVRIDGSDGNARSERAVVFLNPAQTTAAGATYKAKPAAATGAQPMPFGGSIRRIVLSGDVRLEQPGRTGTGDQLVYTAADSSFILTGTAAKPPRMVDAQQGNITGATLLFHSGDNTVIVAGAPPNSTQPKHGRVRTETEVRQ